MAKKVRTNNIYNRKKEPEKKLVDKSWFWIVLVVLVAITLVVVVIGIFMQNKADKIEEEQKEEIQAEEAAKEASGVTVNVNNELVKFINDEGVYAFDANYEGNPATSLKVEANGNVKSEEDLKTIANVWVQAKNIKVGDKSSNQAADSIQYSLTFTRKDGKEVKLSFPTNNIIRVNGVNYDIQNNGFFEYISMYEE